MFEFWNGNQTKILSKKSIFCSVEYVTLVAMVIMVTMVHFHKERCL